MGKLFDLDSPLFNFLSKVADLVMLNIMFIIMSTPIITIGSSFTALYSITLKIAKNEDVHIFKGFIKAFKDNFKQSTIIWLIIILIGGILVLDLRMIYIVILPDVVYNFMRVMLVIIGILYMFILFYIFIYISRFKSSIKLAFKNSLVMSILNFQYTIVIMVFTIGVSSIILWNPSTFIWGISVWILIGFSLTALINSYLFKRVFEKYELSSNTKTTTNL